MSSLQRMASVSSCSSTGSSLMTVMPKPSKALGEIPFVRRRLQHDQTVALLAVFAQKTHPSKEERSALAEQLGMELKTVSAWFQNRRRSLKKKARVWTRNSQENRYVGAGYPAGRKLSRQGSSISLDCIAASKERPMNPDVASPARPPLTPRRNNTLRYFSTPTTLSSNLWDHIPSSPPAPPSSPGADSIRLASLPKQSKRLRSLEWACAKARVGKIQEELEDEESDIPMLVLDCEGKDTDTDVGGEETETEEYEAVTPDVSAVQLTTPQSSPGVLNHKMDDAAPSQDMEAAMALLGFMGPRM